MTDLLQEFCDSRGLALRVDRGGGLIRGIKVLGFHSRNRREYLPDALSRAAGLYEGAKVNVNHPKGHPLTPRDYQERIGVIRNVEHRPGQGLFADFHFNPKHYLSEQLIWDAEHAPENVGFSHNVQARTSRRGETTLVEEILHVHSVDLVADPATTRGLFESSGAGFQPASGAGFQPASESASGATADLLSSASSGATGFASVEQPSDPAETHCQEHTDEVSRLRLELDGLKAKQAADYRRVAVVALLAEYHLPAPDATDRTAKAIVSETFLQSLLAAPDEPAMRRLVEDRARLVTSAKAWEIAGKPAHRQPTSRDQTSFVPPPALDAKSFARAITV
jgi:hypothetical protein